MIKDQIEEAVTQCLQSAQHEYSPSNQKLLLTVSILQEFCNFQFETYQ